ncbi:hypothetical protein BDY24DRAFT_388341, partial [Mrakia frigida]|uniref:uncharacterized protein n=1 Tax=Mrakia frigida TaxID=29902 RepID=UPI003FCBEF71
PTMLLPSILLLPRRIPSSASLLLPSRLSYTSTRLSSSSSSSSSSTSTSSIEQQQQQQQQQQEPDPTTAAVEVDLLPASSQPTPPPYKVDHFAFTPFNKDEASKYAPRTEAFVKKIHLEKLAREKAAVNMFVNEGKMPGEIADEMGVKIGTIRSYFLSQSRSSPSIYHTFNANWERASTEPGTYNFMDCKTIDDAFAKMDGYAAVAEAEKNLRGRGGWGGGKR